MEGCGKQALKPLGGGQQEFPNLVASGVVYVDKTGYIHRMLVDPNPNFFLARPRRFGKTLLLSTIEDILKRGKEEPYLGLDIAKSMDGVKDYSWETSHVIRLSMASCGTDAAKLDRTLSKRIRSIGKKQYGIDIDETESGPAIFDLIESLYFSFDRLPLMVDGKPRTATSPKVAVLIDEYDFQLNNNTDNKEREIIRNTLHAFYASLKSASPMMRFSLATGICRFNEFSPHSGLNNLTDISFNTDYSSACGFTENEIKLYYDCHMRSVFDEWVKNRTCGHHKDLKDVYDTLKKWYDGYTWDGENRVFNPISVIGFLGEKSFKSYWYDLGNANFLKNLSLDDKDIFSFFKNDLSYVGKVPVQDLRKISAKAALLHGGYLTIKDIDKSNGDDTRTLYRLIVPNHEVRAAYSDEYLMGTIYPGILPD
ncbi:MAG: AAA family ATPase [Deltaproteobacteria bacterium]|nr:AAA family ATPase [Deltaproteobacteria bacterium]